GREPVLPEILLALQILAREIEIDPRGFHCGVRLIERRFRSGDAGLTALELTGERSRVDLEQKLAGLHALTFLDRDACHTAGGVGRHVDLALRLNLARGRDQGFQIAGANIFSSDARATVATEVQVGADDGPGN